MTMYPRDRASSAGRTDHNPFTVFRRAFKDNVTSSTNIAISVPTATQPSTSTDGVHELEKGKSLLIYPYGVGLDLRQFRFTVTLWFPLYDRLTSKRITENVAWIPVIASIYDARIKSAITPASQAGPLTTSDYFSNQTKIPSGIISTISTRSGDDMYPSAGSAVTNGGATVSLDTIGAKYVEFDIDIDGADSGSAVTSGNLLFAVI